MFEQVEEESLGAEPSPSPTDTTGGILPAGTHIHRYKVTKPNE